MLGLGLPTKTDPKQVPEELKARVKTLGRQVSHTTIDSIFSGQLVSLGKRMPPTPGLSFAFVLSRP